MWQSSKKGIDEIFFLEKIDIPNKLKKLKFLGVTLNPTF